MPSLQQQRARYSAVQALAEDILRRPWNAAPDTNLKQIHDALNRLANVLSQLAETMSAIANGLRILGSMRVLLIGTIMAIIASIIAGLFTPAIRDRIAFFQSAPPASQETDTESPSGKSPQTQQPDAQASQLSRPSPPFAKVPGVP